MNLNPGQTYTLTIDEGQRLALLEVIRAAGRGGLNDATPLELWVSMLEELPDLEAKEPGIIHGFCY